MQTKDFAMFEYDRARWATFDEVADALGSLAPSRAELVRLGYTNPKLRSLKVEPQRGGLRLFSRAGVVAWVERKFKSYPGMVARVRSKLLPTPKRKAKKQ